MSQLSLLVRHARIFFPSNNKTADALGEAQADDDHWYCVKDDIGGRYVRASEWIGTWVAQDLGIRTPQAEVINLRGRNVFGSKLIANKNDELFTERYLLSDEVTSPIKELLSQIYAYDLFVFNIDRHLHNYLTVGRDNLTECYAFDFSRSLFRLWPITAFPGKKQKTRVCWLELKKRHGFDLSSALALLKRLEAYDEGKLAVVLNRMPPDWLPPPSREEFTSWWQNRDIRLDQIEKGLKNGRLV